jgi:Cu(I)/Ag(I) efflux system periplasmic protein CusF
MKLQHLVLAFAMAMVPAVFATSHHSAAAAMTEGEVRKVDKDAKKITIKHREITNLAMPPMTMAFQVTDAALLDRVKAGDKIRFTAEKVAGAYTVTRIEPAK